MKRSLLLGLLLPLAAPASALDLAQLEKGKFQLKLNTQTLYTVGGPATQDAFLVRQARVAFEGKHPLWLDLGYRVQYETVRSSGVTDAYVEAARKDVVPDLLHLKARLGLTRRPFSLENNQPDPDIELVFRSKVVEALAPGRDTKTLGRDAGAFVEATWTPGLRPDFMKASVGVFNGEGALAADRNKQKDLDLRLSFTPVAWLSVGGSYAAGRRGQPAQVNDRKGADIVLEYGPFAVHGEYLYGRDHMTLREGWYAQAQSWVYKDLLQVVGRYEEYDPDKSVHGDRQKQTGAGLNCFPVKGLRLTALMEMQRDRRKEDRGVFMVGLNL